MGVVVRWMHLILRLGTWSLSSSLQSTLRLRAGYCSRSWLTGHQLPWSRVATAPVQALGKVGVTS